MNNKNDTKTASMKGGENHSRRWVKWIIIGACIVIAALLFIILSAPGNKAKPILMPADIAKVTIYREGTAGTTFSYTDEEKMNRIADYLTSLQLQSTTRTPYGPEVFVGGEWQ